MDWVTPKELEAALIDKCGSRLSILNAICGRVEMDLLRVEADRLIVDGVVSSDASYLKRLFGLRDRLEGSWNMGDIGGTLNRNRHQFMKVQAFGVRFNKGDAEAMGAVFTSDAIESQLLVPADPAESPQADLQTPYDDPPYEPTLEKVPTRSRMSPQNVEEAFAARVIHADSLGVVFTRDQDELFLKSVGATGAVRQRTRELRHRYAQHWSERGRPEKSGN